MQRGYTSPTFLLTLRVKLVAEFTWPGGGGGDGRVQNRGEERSWRKGAEKLAYKGEGRGRRACHGAEGRVGIAETASLRRKGCLMVVLSPADITPNVKFLVLAEG